MNCYNFCHPNNISGSVYVSGTTCGGGPAAFYLLSGQCVCLDVDFAYTTCDNPILSGTCIAPSPTPTITPTQTNTPSVSPTQTATQTPSQTATQTPSQTATQTPSQTATQTPSQTATQTNTPSQTATQTNTPSFTPTQTTTPSPTPFVCFAGTGFNNVVDTSQIDILDNNKIYVAGQFTTYNGVSRENITRIYTNGTIDYTFDSGTGFASAEVGLDILQLSTGKILVGGNLTNYRGNTARGIVRINNDGSYDNTFNTGTGFTGVVRALAKQSDGKIIVGGNMTQFSGQTIRSLVRLNTDGSLDTTFTSPTFTASTADVRKIVVNTDDTIYIAGISLIVSGESRIGPLYLTSGGTYDTSAAFNTSGVGAQRVLDFEVEATGKLMVVGDFDSYNGTLIPARAIRLNANGTPDTTFTGGGFNNYIYEVSIQPDGKYLFNGFIGFYSGVSVNNIVRTNTDGTIDLSFSAGTFSPPPVDSVLHTLVGSDYSIYVGGGFTGYDGYIVNRYVKLYSTGQINDCDLTPVTPTPTPSNTPSVTPSNSPTQTNTPSNSSTPSNTPSVTPSNSPTQTNTPSNTSTSPNITPTNTQTQTETPTNTPSQTATQTPSQTNTQTPDPTPTNTQTGTPDPTPTNTQTGTPDPTPTNTQTPDPTPTQTTTATLTPSVSYVYYNATQYLNCVQNSSPGAYVLRVPTSIDSGTWWCGDDGFQYEFDSNTTGPTYDVTATTNAIPSSCINLPC